MVAVARAVVLEGSQLPLLPLPSRGCPPKLVRVVLAVGRLTRGAQAAAPQCMRRGWGRRPAAVGRGRGRRGVRGSLMRRRTRTKVFTLWTKAEQQLQQLGGCRRRTSDALGWAAVLRVW